MRFYISDLHFGHERLNTEMDRRGFSSGEEMDQYMIRQWNSRVRHGDEVVILGDLCMSKKAKEAEDIIRYSAMTVSTAETVTVFRRHICCTGTSTTPLMKYW